MASGWPKKALRRSLERRKTCPRALKSAASAVQEATKRRFFVFEEGMQNKNFTFFGPWSNSLQDGLKMVSRWRYHGLKMA